MPIAVRILAVPLGLFIILQAIMSAIRTLVLARSARDPVTTIAFTTVRIFFDLRVKRAQSYAEVDRVMAFYAPVGLLVLPFIWMTLLTFGFALIYAALGVNGFYEDFTLSGSSLLTLGFERHDSFLMMMIIFTEASLGLILVALIISYMPTMYSAFSRREASVTMLEVRAGSPPSAGELLTRMHRIRGLEELDELFSEWENWFSDVEESHTSLSPLVFFRSPKLDRSWITASGAVLDAAAIYVSTLDVPPAPQAALCVRAGFLALRAIADAFLIPYNADPAPSDPISITRAEFDTMRQGLIDAGLPVKADADQAWRDFAGWRVNYDIPLLSLAQLTVAPYAPWSSDRGVSGMQR